MSLMNALRGISGEFELNRVVGAFGAAAYVVTANGLLPRVPDRPGRCGRRDRGRGGVEGSQGRPGPGDQRGSGQRRCGQRAGWAVSGLGAISIGARLLGLKSAIGGMVDWVTAKSSHLLLAALAVAGVWGWWGHHQAAKWERVAASTQTRRRADNRIWAGVDRTNHKSIETLIASLDDWSKATRHWADVARGKEAAAQAALGQATARGKAAEAHAQRIDTEGAARVPGATSCVSGKAVLDARGEL